MTDEATHDDPPGSGRDALESVAPLAAAVLRRLVETSPVDPHTGTLVREVCAQATGLTPLPTPAGDAPGHSGVGISAFATQFSVDVSAMDDKTRSRFVDEAGDDAFAAVQAIYVADMVPRVMAVLDRFFGASHWPLATPTTVSPEQYWDVIETLMRQVHALDELDPVLSEIVRLRGARQHNCRLCRSLRSRPSLRDGADEALFDAIDAPGWPDLPNRTRAALALTDALIWHPARLDDELVDHVRRELAPSDVVEVVLDVMRNAANKIAVAFGADDPHVEDGLEIYEIDEGGVAHYGLAL